MANFTSILTGKQIESRLANYGVCSTAAANVATKVVTVGLASTNNTKFELTAGLTVRIKFTNSNTAANPTLNVNGTGAKSIMIYGTITPGTTVDSSWAAGSIVSLTYDGDFWIMENIQPNGLDAAVEDLDRRLLALEVGQRVTIGINKGALQIITEE